DNHGISLDNRTFHKISALQDRDAHRLEKVGVDHPKIDSGSARYVHVGIAIEQDGHDGVANARPPVEGQNAGGARLLHSRNGLYLFDHPPEKIRYFTSKTMGTDLGLAVVKGFVCN